MDEKENSKTSGLLLAILLDVILLMAYVSLGFIAYSGAVDFIPYVRYILIWLVILLISIVAFQIPRVLVQYGQHFFNIEPEEMFGLLLRLVLGHARYPPQAPMLKIKDGKMSSAVAGVIEKVGGPAFLNVEHNNAVVTERLGVLTRVLGPGYHRLEPFEKVWDIVDLRPQRRSVTVHFITRDGIPASVAAEVVFRIPFIDEYLQMRGSTKAIDGIAGKSGLPAVSSFSPDAVLDVATGKKANGPQAYTLISEWVNWLPEDILDRVIRDNLEQYVLDDFLHPQYWLSLTESVDLDGKAEYKVVRPKPLTGYKNDIDGQVKSLAAAQGIFVEYVEIGPVLPVEDAIPRAWLEFWQAKLHSVVYQHSIQVNVNPEENKERAAIGMLVDLINSTVQQIQLSPEHGLKVPPALVVLSFISVLQSLSEKDAAVQHIVNRNAAIIATIVEAIQRLDPPADVFQTSSNA